MASFKPHLYAVSPPGFEEITALELRKLGARKVDVHRGGVAFSGKDGWVMRANLHLRTASRVLKVVHQSRVTKLSGVIGVTEQIPWERYVKPGRAVEVHASATKSRLYHTGAIAQRVAAVVGSIDGKGPPQGIWVRVVRDMMTISVDTSGELLHKRGYRQASVRAPIRENVAAALLLANKWNPDLPLFDPMCGSGTIPIEAAMLAINRAPGLQREFAFERWPSLEQATWQRLRTEARNGEKKELPTIIGCDANPEAIAAAISNAKRLKLDVMFEEYDASELLRPDGPGGLLIANPPYGRRVPGARSAVGHLVQLARDWKGWTTSFITGRRGPIPPGFKEVIHFTNGGVPVRLLSNSD